MATVAGDVLTLDEWVKRLTKDETRAIIEIVAQNNLALSSMMVTAGNEADGNTTTVRTDMPTGTWTSANEGVGTEASHTEELWDQAGTLEAFSAINQRYIHRSPDQGAARAQEDVAFVIGFSENVEDKVFNGDHGLFPKQFTGFTPRFNTLSGSDTSDQVVGGGGSGSDQTDIWFVGWGPLKCSLFFGKNQTGGLKTTDMGIRPWQMTASSTNRVMAFVKHYEWSIGLKVENYKSISRVANIDTTTFVDIVPLMIDAFYRIPTKLHDGNMKIYCNRTIAAQLHKEARAMGNGVVSIDQYAGQPIVHFLGIPIIQTDAISNTNTAIT